MCCAASSAARSATATSSVRAMRSSTRWCPIWSRRMGTAYPELAAEQVRVKGILSLEEERFLRHD